jgi:hypothetical protein
MKKLITLLFFVSLFSCEENKQIIENPNNLLIGNWASPTYDSEKTTFTRSASLQNEGSGITFKQNGDLIERTSGWCGTPPLTYFNVEGTFTLENDLISISKESYPAFYGWKILELTEEKLVVKRELSEQEKDHRTLMDLYNEIIEIAYSKTCTDINDWSFIGFGAKACGGLQGYTPYHKDIDVPNFLEKVEAYTNAEKEFNIKWSIISDCTLVNPPKSVDCQYEYPVLTY